PNFAQAGQGLQQLQQQQQGLKAAVAAGELWMEPDVAERAAARCEQGIDEVDQIIYDLEPLARERKFGKNDHGHQVATAFKDAAVTGENSVAGVLRESKDVLRDMAQTFRDAGRAASVAEQANQRMFDGGAQ
ncbi:MAG: hypothetical protein ACRDRZ_09775, partial [Pseudonocardiaceae bacterium]